VDVLLANDCEVFTPRRQNCCGSILGHNGELALARQVARRNLARSRWTNSTPSSPTPPAAAVF